MSGIGPCTIAPWKVAVSGLHKTPRFQTGDRRPARRVHSEGSPQPACYGGCGWGPVRGAGFWGVRAPRSQEVKTPTWELRNRFVVNRRDCLTLSSGWGCPEGLLLPTLCWEDASCLAMVKTGWLRSVAPRWTTGTTKKTTRSGSTSKMDKARSGIFAGTHRHRHRRRTHCS